jgi:tetratricopeptide (TPR) repeat protein
VPNAAPAVVDSAQPLSTVQGLFDVAKWRRGGTANFQNDLAALKDRHTNAGPNDRRNAGLDLAEFYFANGYGPESSGEVDRIRSDDRSADNDPLVMALGAAARVMTGEDRRAEQLLAMPALQSVPEANLMRAVVAADKGDTAGAARLFAGPLPDISEYPEAFRNRIRLLAAQSLIDAGDPLTAQNYLDPIKQSNPDPESAARAAYLDGQRLMKLGKKKEALDIWQGLVDNPSDEIKAKSRFAVVSAKLEDKSIDPKDAATQIEALRYLWRGDTFEFDLLYKLGHLYLDTDQPRRGLITLRQAATHFPDHPMAKQAADDMTEAFRKLYLEGGADKLSPLTAVALYDEFRELTPSGPDGDRMIAALADRLVKVDLLGSAADLLERQVKLRLSGIDKVKAGTRLAAIRLLDDKPDLALKALTASDDPAVTPDLQEERQRLQARAAFDTGDTLKGIGLVRDDSSLEGLWLKSDMYWELREWPSAADALGQLIIAEQAKLATEAALKGQAGSDVAKNPASVLDKALAQAKAAAAADGDTIDDADADSAGTNKAPAGSPMDPVLSRLVLNRAVALSLAGDRRGLKDIGRSFGAQMKTTPFAQPFQVLTSPDAGLTDSIAAQMKSVDQLGTFVEEYRKILQAKSLSGATEPNPDTGPLAPTDAAPSAVPGSGASTAPNPPTQTAAQPNGAQPAGQ